MFSNQRIKFRAERHQAELAKFVEQKHREVALVYANIWLNRHPEAAPEDFRDPLNKIRMRTKRSLREAQEREAQAHIDRLIAEEREYNALNPYIIYGYIEEADYDFQDQVNTADHAILLADHYRARGYHVSLGVLS